MKISYTAWERERTSESLVDLLDKLKSRTLVLATPTSLDLVMGNMKKFCYTEDSIKRNLLLKIASRNQRIPAHSRLRRNCHPQLQKADSMTQNPRINYSRIYHSILVHLNRIP